MKASKESKPSQKLITKKLATAEQKLARIKYAGRIRRQQNVARRFVTAMQGIVDRFFLEK